MILKESLVVENVLIWNMKSNSKSRQKRKWKFPRPGLGIVRLEVLGPSHVSIHLNARAFRSLACRTPSECNDYPKAYKVCETWLFKRCWPSVTDSVSCNDCMYGSLHRHNPMLNLAYNKVVLTTLSQPQLILVHKSSCRLDWKKIPSNERFRSTRESVAVAHRRQVRAHTVGKFM
jgi:hypothetical protein